MWYKYCKTNFVKRVSLCEGRKGFQSTIFSRKLGSKKLSPRRNFFYRHRSGSWGLSLVDGSRRFVSLAADLGRKPWPRSMFWPCLRWQLFGWRSSLRDVVHLWLYAPTLTLITVTSGEKSECTKKIDHLIRQTSVHQASADASNLLSVGFSFSFTFLLFIYFGFCFSLIHLLTVQYLKCACVSKGKSGECESPLCQDCFELCTQWTQLRTRWDSSKKRWERRQRPILKRRMKTNSEERERRNSKVRILKKGDTED